MLYLSEEVFKGSINYIINAHPLVINFWIICFQGCLCAKMIPVAFDHRFNFVFMHCRCQMAKGKYFTGILTIIHHLSRICFIITVSKICLHSKIVIIELINKITEKELYAGYFLEEEATKRARKYCHCKLKTVTTASLWGNLSHIYYICRVSYLCRSNVRNVGAVI